MIGFAIKNQNGLRLKFTCRGESTHYFIIRPGINGLKKEGQGISER